MLEEYKILSATCSLFEMAAIPFPCNGLLLCCVNIPTVLLMFFNKFASCSIPYFNSNLINKANIMSSNMILSKFAHLLKIVNIVKECLNLFGLFAS